jgi:2-polyprenyl-3-methyl-5-hydroxy-6-metoxy-1,4-benzoquinol methylase
MPIKHIHSNIMNPLDAHLEAYQGKYIYEFDNQIQLKWYPGRITEFSNSESSVLELGLGHGITTNIFSNYFRKYKVIDASPAVINNFRNQFSECRANVVESYFENFESEEKFDIIILGFIMEHVDDPGLILEKYKKFLKPQGRIFISVPNAEVMNRRLGKYTGDLSDIFLLSEHDKVCGHKRYYTVCTLSEQIIHHGYKILRIEGIYFKPLSTEQMISLDLQPKYITALCELGVHYPELCCGILVEFTI